MYRLSDRKSGKQAIFEQTGMPLPPMYPTHKILWMKADMVRLYKRVHKFLCFEYFVFFKLGLKPVIDHSLASGAMAFDTIQKRWSDEKLKTASADEELLAAAEPSENIVGCLECSTSKALGLQGEVYAITGGHDQACGAIWAAIMGQAKAMHATGLRMCAHPLLIDHI